MKHSYQQEEVKDKKIDAVLIRRLLAYLYPYRYSASLALFFLLIAKGIEIWIPVRIGQLVQDILQGVQGKAGKASLFQSVVATSWWLIGWILVGYLFDNGNILIKNRIGQKALLTLRMDVYKHILRLPLTFYDHQAMGRLMTRVIHDVDQINQLFSESILPLLGSLFLFVGILISVFILNWQVALTLCTLLPLVWWVTHTFRVQQRQTYNLIRSISSAMNAFIQEHLMGAHIIRTFGLQAQEKKKFDEINHDYREANLDTVYHYAFFFAWMDVIQNLALIVVFALLFLLTQTVGEPFQAGTYFTFSLYAMMVFRPLLDLADRYNILQSAIAAAERIFEILDIPEETKGAIPGLPLTEVEEIRLEHVWFAYQGEDWILKDFSLTLKKGESVALVGMTGAGKTSVLNLLLRFYEFQKGAILINGHDIRAYAIEALRSQFSLILQDPTVFSGTIQDNMTLYQPMSHAQIEQMIDQVHLQPMVSRFSDGLSHRISERGLNLSVGEMQLIALARALIQRRSVLMLDEATANIDIETEKTIQDILKRVLATQTSFIIAHRLTTIREVHRIVVLHQGRVVEMGTHQELLDLKGVYEKLYRLRFSN